MQGMDPGFEPKSKQQDCIGERMMFLVRSNTP